MENEKKFENIPDNLNIIKSQNDNIDSKNNLNTQTQLKDHTQDNAEIIQINNINNNNINNNIDINNGNNKNIIRIELNNKNIEEKNNNDPNISILKQTTNKNLSNPIINQNINGNNIDNQSPNQVVIVNQQNNGAEEEVNCRENYPFCYCNIKFILCYNCFDNSEENLQKKENAPVYNIFCLAALFYYILYIISEIILFAFILIKYIFICLYKCFLGCCKMWDEAKRDAEIERQKKLERDRCRVNEINNDLKDLDSEHDKVDRSIVFGNPLNDPGYQARMIDHYDRKYLEQRESLERERNQIIKNM